MSANEKAANAKSEQKAKKHRSPGFPIISIDDAITRLRVIFQHDKRAYTTADTILSHLGYRGTARSGTAGRVVSALRQYGLLDENGGQYRVSDTGFKILHLPEDSDERANLIREAALNPPIFQKIVAHYQGEIPSDAALRSHLILQEKFNPDSVNQFIRVFRQTITVANPSPDDYTVGDESEGAERQSLAGGRPAMQPTPPTPTINKAQVAPSVQQTEQKPLFQYNVPLSIQRDVNAHLVITGSSLKKRDLEVLGKKVKDLVDAFEEEELEPVKAEPVQSQPAPPRPAPLPVKPGSIARQFEEDPLTEAFQPPE
jgi:hypothetical protein